VSLCVSVSLCVWVSLISSTLMDMESTVSSGRSTPAMMNDQATAAGTNLCFTCSPDLPEHIRALHVDGQRVGVGSIRNQDKIGLCSFGRKPFETEPHDFFDTQTMDAIRHRSTGNGHSVVFHSTVMARRREGSGKVKVLLHWTPEDIQDSSLSYSHYLARIVHSAKVTIFQGVMGSIKISNLESIQTT
uniref:AEBP2-like C-terminal SH3 domain-containing protein n=1 Tax=Oncorhynchus kisutch TaxID=8019 RepID=A0A8C7CYQ9_ONCKI